MPVTAAYPNGVGLHYPAGVDLITTVAAVGHSVEHLGAAGNVVRVLNRTAGAYARVSDAGPLVQGAFKASYSQERELDPNAGGYTFLTAYASDGSPMFMINHHSNNSTYIQLYYWTGSGAWTGGPHLYFGTQYGAIPRVRLTEMAF
jgi:hypothetical protein